MFTRCPDCHTTFLITEQQLGAASGNARCGRCGVVFDARAALLPESRDDHEADPKANTESELVQPVSAPTEEIATASAASAHRQAEPQAIPDVLLEDFEDARNRAKRRPGWVWTFAILLLAVTLVTQYAYFMRRQLVNEYPQSRPWLLRMCGILSYAVPCDVPFAKDLTKLKMLSSDVSEHPDARATLVIQATFVNLAQFTQPFPVLELKLSDLHGQAIALQRFRPAQYLPEKTNTERGLAPRTPVTALFEVTRPFGDVNSYSFAFY